MYIGRDEVGTSCDIERFKMNTSMKYLVYCTSSKSHCGEVLFQGPIQCGDNSREASTENDKHSFDNQHCNPFIRMNNARAHTYIAVNSLTSGEILRAAFIGMIHLEVW